MPKLIKFLCAALLIIFHFNVKASVYITLEQFNSMTVEDQNKIIIEIMKLVSEMEKTHPEEFYQTTSFEKLKKYTTLLNELPNLILNQAYAQSIGKDLNKYGEEFINLTSKDRPNRCLYAGWISKLVTKNINGKQALICSHPQKLDPNSEEYKAYVKADKKCDHLQDKISCNPAIFGFKKANDQSLFCVDAGLLKSVDSSLECMKLSLNFSNQNGTADTRDERLKNLRDNLSKNQKFLDGVQHFTFNTCLCEKGTKDSIDKRYLNKIRPHRTCYGLMRTIKETVILCNDQSPLGGIDDFKLLEKGLIEKLDQSGLKNSQFDKAYQDYLATMAKESENDVKRICEGGPTTAPTPTAPAPTAPTSNPVQSTYKCKVTCTDTEAKIPVYPSNDPDQYSQMLLTTRNQPIQIDLSKPGPELNVSKPVADQPQSDSITDFIQTESTQKPLQNCEYQVVITKEGKEEVVDKEKYETPKDLIVEKDTKVSIKILENNSDVSCEVEKKDYKKENSNNENECSITTEIKTDDDKKNVEAKISLKSDLDGEKTYTWKENESLTDKATYEFKENLKIEGSIRVGDKTFECSTDVKDKSAEDKTPKIQVTTGPVTPSSIVLIARIDDEDEIPSGYTIVWKRDPAAKKLGLQIIEEKENPKKSETPSGIAQDTDGDKPKEDKPKEDKPKKDDPENNEVGTGTKITEPRSPNGSYKTCAYLMKESKKVGEDCQSIPRMDIPRSVPSGRPNIPMVTPPYNPANWVNDGVR